MQPISAGQVVYVLCCGQVVACRVAFSSPPIYGVVNTGEPPRLLGAPEAITVYGDWDISERVFTDRQSALDALREL